MFITRFITKIIKIIKDAWKRHWDIIEKFDKDY